MKPTDNLAAEIYRTFERRVDEALKRSSREDRGKDAESLNSMYWKIATGIVDKMKQEHPEAVFEPYQISMWESMRWWEKVCWYLAKLLSQDMRIQLAEEYKIKADLWEKDPSRAARPAVPVWLLPYPKVEKTVGLKVGIPASKGESYVRS